MCRQAYASLTIPAGVNVKALSTQMGDASSRITLDRYGHLMPGNEVEAAELLYAYLTPVGAGSRHSGADRRSAPVRIRT